jgi:hypothetical protein
MLFLLFGTRQIGTGSSYQMSHDLSKFILHLTSLARNSSGRLFVSQSHLFLKERIKRSFPSENIINDEYRSIAHLGNPVKGFSLDIA